MDSHNTILNWIGNVASLGAIGGTLLSFLPFWAAGIAIIWYLIQIKESDTYQKWTSHRRQRKIARLRAQIIIIEDSLYLDPDPPSGPAGGRRLDPPGLGS